MKSTDRPKLPEKSLIEVMKFFRMIKINGDRPKWILENNGGFSDKGNCS